VLTALLVGFLGIPAVTASVQTPQLSLRAMGGRPVWVPICSRRGVNGSAAYFDATSTSVMDQQFCVSPAWGTVTALKLVFAAFDMPQQGEVDRPVTATGTAAVFVPALNVNPITGIGAVPSGSSTLTNFPATGSSTNGISLGQTVTASGGGIAAGTYVTGVTNSFVTGGGNTPSATTVAISTPTTAALWNTEGFTFSGLFVPVRFGGKRSFTVEPGHDVVTSDPVSVELPAGTQFMVRTSASFSGTGLQLMDVPVTARMTITTASGSFSEFDSRGTTLNDQTMTPVSLSNTGGGYWGPVMVLALVAPSAGRALPGAALVLGDSIGAGTGDTPDALGLEGYFQRSFENNMPFVTAARGSTTAAGLLAHGDGQYALSIDAGITDVFLELGRNDIQQSLTSATQLENTIASITSRYLAAGKRVWCFTVPPTTYSNDAWTTLANQSFPAAVGTTGGSTIASGATTLSMASVASIAVGQSVALNGSTNSPAQAIAPGTVVNAVNIPAVNITISNPTVASLAAGTKLYFGSSTPGAAETQRQKFNNDARSNWRGGSICSGLIDIDSIVADQGLSNKWRVDLGQASADGVHPSTALHQAVVNSGVLSPSRFTAP
jgi:hypothetical protein